MSTLLVVRHAQASFFAEDYDHLSPLGEQQALALGDYLVRAGAEFDEVYTGPRRRHQRTAELAGSRMLEAGRSWPQATIIPEWDEHSADLFLSEPLDEIADKYQHLQQLKVDYRSAREPMLIQRSFQKLFEALVHLWVQAEIAAPGVEPWADFQSRVIAGVKQITQDETGGRRALLVTSVGPISIAMQHALGVNDAMALELGWRVRNASLTGFLFSGDRFTLDFFNASPHLSRKELLTYR